MSKDMDPSTWSREIVPQRGPTHNDAIVFFRVAEHHCDVAAYELTVPAEDLDVTRTAAEVVAKSQPLFIGHIKWDGCANLDFVDHLCGPEGADVLCDALTAAYRIAKDAMQKAGTRTEW